MPMKSVLLTPFIMCMTGCASIGTLTVTSTPEKSDVIVINSNNNRTVIGQTPLDISLDRVFDSGDRDYARITVLKEGYFENSVVLPRSSFTSRHRVNFNLIPLANSTASGGMSEEAAKKLDQCKEISRESMNRLSEGIASTQATILRGDYDVANVKLGQLISEFPHVSVLYDLQGNVFYLQKQYVKALRAYETSLVINPKSVETAIIIQRLREITGRTSQGGTELGH
ncbi:MAG: hypothetical protein HQK54_08220 [Oligoflexales bacterium]|nr:hypothetical protein [Oligoflexales bacterium]